MLPLIFTAWLLIGSPGAAELLKVVILATGGTIAGEQKKPGEAGYGIDAQVQLAPGAASLGSMLLDQPSPGPLGVRV
jgi:L-asparaginase/Glu-tRNA(Gln) amidotransferase subunit D